MQGGGRSRTAGRPTREWGAYFRGATVQAIAISGDRAAATLSNDEIVQLRRTATGEWLIDKLGEDGLTAELRRKLRVRAADRSSGSCSVAGLQLGTTRRSAPSSSVAARRAAPRGYARWHLGFALDDG